MNPNAERLTAKINLSMKPSLREAIDQKATELNLSRQDLCRVALSLIAQNGIDFAKAGQVGGE